ncbi:MAG: DUF3276 family protein [Phycisphaerales bacterium]|nr:MAG: DUF3276 family protein [Phycisphaerales bacterium]
MAAAGQSRGSSAGARRSNSPRASGKSKPDLSGTVRTWAFDSLGNRKYAVQIRKAKNGNPCLKIVEGVPQDDGTYRRFSLTIWSEDFPKFWQTMDEVRQFMIEKDIKTPAGHKYVPGKNKKQTTPKGADRR